MISGGNRYPRQLIFFIRLATGLLRIPQARGGVTKPFQPGPEPDAHDGVRFQGPPGVTLTVSGSYNVTSDTPSSAAANELNAVASGPLQVTYRAARNHWAAASGI